MRVFVTGATGFIGSLVVKELIAAGHQVIGLCRSDDKAPALAAAGAEVYRGSIDDPDSLKDGAARSDGVIHLAFNHDFSKIAASCENDRRVIQTLGSILSGSDRPLVVTSVIPLVDTAADGKPAREDGTIVSSRREPTRSCRRGRHRSRGGRGERVGGAPAASPRHGEARACHLRESRYSAKKASAPMSGTGSIVGLRRMFSMWRASTGWRSKRPSRTLSITRLQKRGCQCAILRAPLAAALSCRSNPSRGKRPKLSSAGSPLHCPPLQLAPKGGGRYNGRGGRRPGARYRGNDWSTPEAAGQIHHAGGGGSLFRLARPLGRARHARLEREDAEEARVAADRAWVDRRSRTIAYLRELKPTRDHRRRRDNGACANVR